MSPLPPSWISDQNNFSYFWSISHPDASYQIQGNWPFSCREEGKNWFSRWLPWRPSWISDRNNLSYFWSTSHPYASYRVSSQLAQGCRRSRLLKQIVDATRQTPHNGRSTTEDRHWLIIIAHLQHFMLRRAKNI